MDGCINANYVFAKYYKILYHNNKNSEFNRFTNKNQSNIFKKTARIFTCFSETSLSFR